MSAEGDYGHVPVEEMEVFRKFVAIADRVWGLVEAWRPLAQETVGKQLIRAVDSVGAKLVEGDGRYSHADALHFSVIARGSAREARYWLSRAAVRQLIDAATARELVSEIESASRLLNSLITYRRTRTGSKLVREGDVQYDITGVDAQHPTPNTQHPEC